LYAQTRLLFIVWHGAAPYKPAAARAPITIGTAGVIHPGAIGSPNINGPADIKVPDIRLKAIASLKDKPIAIAIGAAANAVAPEITKP
jgi:hypothetical protein